MDKNVLPAAQLGDKVSEFDKINKEAEKIREIAKKDSEENERKFEESRKSQQ